MKKLLHLLFAFIVLSVWWQVKAQGLTCATASPVTPGTFTASTLIGTPSQTTATAAGWYAYTPTSNGILNINSCSGGSDTRLWIWSGTCTALTAVANNDDFAGCISTGTSAYASKIENVILMAGTTYYFEWDNVWEATGFTWSFTFAALPANNDAGITFETNRNTRIPISQASYGIPLGATVKNFSGATLTNVVLTTEIYELPNTTTPVQTYVSTPVSLGIGVQQVLTSGTWAPVLTVSKSYLIKYIKTQTEVDGVTSNDITTQNLTLDFNYTARDNNAYQVAYNWSSTLEYTQGVVHTVYGAGNMTGAVFYLQSTSTTQVYNVQVFQLTNGVVATTPLYTSANITANGAGLKLHTFPTPIAVTAGEYLIAIKKTGIVSFPVGADLGLFTAGKNLVRTGAAGAWTPVEAFGVSPAFIIRPKFGTDPTSDIAFINNRNPGGENTKIHTRQSLSGNDLQFWARAANVGTATVTGVTMTVTVKDASNATVYTATSAAQDLTAGQIDTFTVANFNVTALGAYTIDYVFNNTGDQIPQNNTKTTTFTRTTGEMSRTVGVTGSLGLNSTTVANNIVFGNNYALTQNDFLDSVQFVLRAGTPVGYVASVNIYATTLNATTGAMVPDLTPIASTLTYTTTAADNLNGVTVKVPVSGGTLNLAPGTYFFGVYQAASTNGNIRLATSADYFSPGMTYYRWDQSTGGNWQSPASINYSFVVNPIFKSCVAYNQTVATTAAACGANNGSATVTTTGGTGTINFAWANGNSTPTISNATAGQYGLTLTDVNGCPFTFNVVVPSQSNLTVTATTQDVTCGGQSTGSILLNASQGITPYVYTWANNLGSAASLTNIPAGAYQVTVSDATGCIVIFNDTVVELSNLTGTMNGTDVLCNNTQTGNLEISATSGVTPYTYQWVGTSNTGTYVTSVGPGTYSCIVTDGLGCTDTVTTVLAVTDLSATASTSNPLCYGTNTGSVTLVASGGTGPYTYDWAGSTASNTVLSGLGEGSYSVVVTDAYGCSTSASASVNEPAAWVVSAAVTPAIFGTDGAIDLTVNGATGPYTYSWDNNATTQDLNNIDGGTYVVTITDSLGCTYSDSIVVNSIVGLDIQDLNAAQVFPNPSNGDFFIAGPVLTSITLYNQFGQKVNAAFSTIGEGKYQVLTTQLANGSYILELQNEGAIVRKSIQIIQ
ncbi:MAG: T9SS type A sorting domain-containing protein [Cryomorphaceae bacterium]|nr:T9SS type A sorting domain-containing protein [Cryomorphaceae bacterium]